MEDFVFHPIYSLSSDRLGGQAFDYGLLPLPICNGVTLEDVRALLLSDAFSTWKGFLSKEQSEQLARIKYTVVRRFDSSNERARSHGGFEPVEAIMACIRLIRPMREHLGLVRGKIRDDGTFDVHSFSSPYAVFEVPEVEKLFSFRNQDAIRLQQLAPRLIAAYETQRHKIIMAVEFFQAGFFETRYWKSRYSLRCSSVEALFSSRKHRSSKYSKKRIKALLGAGSQLYEEGDIPSHLPQASDITVEKALPELYEARNSIAHGDRIPDRFFREQWRKGVQGDLSIMAVLDEAASIIARRSILVILENGLEEHFSDSDATDRYFSSVDEQGA